MPILPFKKGVAEGFCFKVILDISSKAGHNCEINEDGVMFVKLSRSRLTAYPCKSLPACLTQSSKSSCRRRYPAANHLKPSSLLLLIKPMARRINLRSQIRQLREPRSATCRRYSTSPPSLATSTACRNTRRLAII